LGTRQTPRIEAHEVEIGAAPGERLPAGLQASQAPAVQVRPDKPMPETEHAAVPVIFAALQIALGGGTVVFRRT